MKSLRLILGDQLNPDHSWFQDVDDDCTYALFEMRQETDYVRHHIQKVVGFFAAMRNFAADLRASGHHVIYYNINDKDNTQNLEENIRHILENEGFERFQYLMPDEYRLDVQLRDLCAHLAVPCDAFDTEHFYTERGELADFFEGKKQFLMESFYRYMRKKHGILMTGNQPEGGKWNFDQSNRKKWKGTPSIPPPILFDNEISEIIEDIAEAGINTIGHREGDIFNYPINQGQAHEQLQYFCQYLLPYFGDFQDAMHTQQKFLFHSRLSFAMNTKIISPKTVVDKVLEHYRANQNEIHISQIEGFIRQIVGWREYMRGIYWKEMPGYARMNALDNYQPLPDFYWTGNTKMNCLATSISDSLDHAYAHHIQRLMITGNFALLAQVDPDEVDRWYLGIYIDAIQWVEITNTRGMSQYADGGIIATKPYVSSSAYINKMGNYCQQCNYDRTIRTGKNACPFNSLYWNFLYDKSDQLQSNHRMGMMYNLLSKIPETELQEIRERASKIIAKPDAY